MTIDDFERVSRLLEKRIEASEARAERAALTMRADPADWAAAELQAENKALQLKLDSYRALVASVVDCNSAQDAVRRWLKGVGEMIEAPAEAVCHCSARSENECTCH